MSKVVAIPEAVGIPPSDAFVLKGCWIEVQYPPRGKLFVGYGSAGEQFHVRVHKHDEIVGRYTQYVYDGTGTSYLSDFIDKTLLKCGLKKYDYKKVWEHRVEYREDGPKYIKFDKKEHKKALIRKQKSFERQAEKYKQKYEWHSKIAKSIGEEIRALTI